MRIGALYSGGKDSTMAVHWAKKQHHDVVCLITLEPERTDSYMYQHPNVHLTSYHAQAMGIPLISLPTSGVKEEELVDLRDALTLAKEKYEIEGVSAGALASTYQKERVEKIATELGLEVFAPYWGAEPENYLREILLVGLQVIITGIAAEGLDKSFLGRTLTAEMISELKAIHEKTKFHLGFEGGEAETMVLDAPFFKQRIEVVDAVAEMDGTHSGYYTIKKLVLVDK